MARVSMRIGLGKSTLIAGPLAVFFGACALGAWHGALHVVAGAFALASALNVFFALAHPDKVLALDDDDPTDLQVGDRVE